MGQVRDARGDPDGGKALRHRPASGRDRRYLDGRLRRLRPGAAAPEALLRRRRSLPRAVVRERGNGAWGLRQRRRLQPQRRRRHGRGNPDAFEGMRVWNDYGDADPFRVYDEGFVGYLRNGGAELSAHTWDGGH